MEYIKEPDNFCEIPESYSNYTGSRVVVLPFPYEKTTCYVKGTENGPDAIIKASTEVELYDEELGNIFEVGICTLKPLMVDEKPEAMANIIYRNVKKLL